MHAKFSQSRVFFSIGVPKSNEKKNNHIWSTHATKVQFTAYLQGFMNPLSPRRLKTACFFFKIVSYFFPHWRWKPRKNRGQKSLLKSNLECWQNCLWFSCFSLFLLWFFIGFCGSHWFFLDVFIDFLVSHKFHVLFFAYHCFCSLVFIVFSSVFLWFSCFVCWFSFVVQRFLWFLYHSLMFL